MTRLTLAQMRDRLTKMGPATDPLLAIILRMEEIDAYDTAPDGDTYRLLWDALLDEIGEAVENATAINARTE